MQWNGTIWSTWRGRKISSTDDPKNEREKELPHKTTAQGLWSDWPDWLTDW